MTKKSTKAEINLFNAGINTEANLLNFPPNASRDEENFDLNKNGVRERRLGIDYEDNYALFNLGISEEVYKTQSHSTFKWDRAGGNANNTFLVVQIGNTIHIFDSQVNSISSEGFLTSITIDKFPIDRKFSFTAVDGYLVVVSGEDTVFRVIYDTITKIFNSEYERIKVRDLWGVEVVGSNYESDTLFRDETIPSQHIYNLRNQSWAFPRRKPEVGLKDPIDEYFNTLGKYPSNSESVWIGMTMNTDGTTEVFRPTLMRDSIGADISSARGFFIIDLLRRGNSRSEEYGKNQSRNIELIYNIGTLPEDVTLGGPSIVTEYAGRVWYAGFGGEVINGDSRSPNLVSYVCFSQLVNSPEDILKCYQKGDPSSRDASDIVDTDGGFIRISGASKIVSMVSLGRDLVVFAENGVWAVSGGSDYGFTATNYSVERISNYGCISTSSVIVEGDRSFYWSEDGIYATQRDQIGKLHVSSITQSTIQTLYENIDVTQKAKATGVYDSFERKVRWLYNVDEELNNNNFVFELILNTETGAFTKNRIYNLTTNTPEVIGFVLSNPYRKGSDVQTVVVSSASVTAASVPVVITETIRTSGIVSVKYLTVVFSGGTARITFSEYRNQQFLDWKTANGVGVDASAFILTGDITAGDSSVHKQVPYLVMHFFRTEMTATNGVPDNQSGCLVRSQWDWASSVNSGKWSPQFQTYRYRRPYFVTGPVYDNGFETVVTRNKLRGRGRAFSLLIETETEKDCRIIGWNLSINGNSIT